MTASFLLISLQTQSFLLAGPYIVCAPPPPSSFPTPISFPFLFSLASYLSSFPITSSHTQFLLFSLLPFLNLASFAFVFCLCYFTFFFSLLHLDLLFFSPCFMLFLNFSFFPLLLSLSSFLSFPLSFLFLFVLLPFVLQCISPIVPPFASS